MHDRPAGKRGKWIHAASPDVPVSDVARAALEQRLRSVAQWLPRAADLSRGQIEDVHQLRVASRRAAAALETFAHLLPRRRVRWMRRQLKRVRRAAGEARDLDVLLDRLQREQAAVADSAAEGHPAADDPAGKQQVISRIAAERRQAQRPIERSERRLPPRRWQKRIRALVRRVRFRPQRHPRPAARERHQEPTYRAAARTALQPLCERLFAIPLDRSTELAQWHRMRIEAKRLRYAMELFAGAFDERFRNLCYPIVEELQERLGNVNDQAAAAARFAAWQVETESGAEREALIDMHLDTQAAVIEMQEAFLHWWTASQRDLLRRGLEDALAATVDAAPLAT